MLYGNHHFTDVLVYMQNNNCTWHIIPVRPVTLCNRKIDDSSKFECTEYHSEVENFVIIHHFQGKGLEANIQQTIR